MPCRTAEWGGRDAPVMHALGQQDPGRIYDVLQAPKMLVKVALIVRDDRA
jgi:hypothetical protein